MIGLLSFSYTSYNTISNGVNCDLPLFVCNFRRLNGFPFFSNGPELNKNGNDVIRISS